MKKLKVWLVILASIPTVYLGYILCALWTGIQAGWWTRQKHEDWVARNLD